MKILLTFLLACLCTEALAATIFSNITRTNTLTETNLFLTSTPVAGGTRTIYFSDVRTAVSTNLGAAKALSLSLNGITRSNWNNGASSTNDVPWTFKLTEIAGSELIYTNYSAFPNMGIFSSGKIVIFFASGTSHTSADAKLAMISSTDGGNNWTAPTFVLSEVGVTYASFAAGIVANNRCILFYNRYNGTTWLDNNYIYSDDEGLTWSTPILVGHSTLNVFPPFNKIINIASNQIMMAYSGRSAGPTNYSVHVLISSDFGLTWGSDITVISSGTTAAPQYGEESFVYLGGSRILGLIRQNDLTAMRQVISTNNGLSWSNVGDITFDSALFMSPWLETFIGPAGKRVVVCYYEQRTANRVRAVYGYAEDLINNGVAGWNSSSRVDVATMVDGFNAGYTSVIHPNDSQNGFGVFYDDTSSTNATLKFFIPPKTIPLGITTSAGVTIADDSYAGTWNGNLSVPTKNAVYDKIEGLVITGTNLITQTNFVLNTVYTNGSQAILARATAALTGAAVSGVASLDLMVDQSGGGTFSLVGRSSMTTSTLAQNATNEIAVIVKPLGTYYFTNSSSGAGNSALVVDSTGQTVTLSGSARPTRTILLPEPRFVDGVGAQMSVTVSSSNNRQANLSASAATNGNYCAYYLQVPSDIDITKDVVLEHFYFRLGGADTAAHKYTISMHCPNVSDDPNFNQVSSINHVLLPFAGDALGASNNIEDIAEVTLTNWAASLTGGKLLQVIIARDGTDASTVTSTTFMLTLRFGVL